MSQQHIFNQVMPSMLIAGVVGAGVFAMFLRRQAMQVDYSFIVDSTPEPVNTPPITDLVQKIKDNLTKIKSILFNNPESISFQSNDEDNTEVKPYLTSSENICKQ